MVKRTPYHLLNQPVTVVSGGLTYPGYGDTAYSEVVLSSGTGRLQFDTVRDPATGLIATSVRFYLAPEVEAQAGHLAVIAGARYRINSRHDYRDRTGDPRLAVLVLEEVDR